MKKIVFATLLLSATMNTHAYSASKNNVGDYACVEAASETLKKSTPKAIRATAIKHCKAAFSDRNHRSNTTKACDKQAVLATKDLQFLVAYTCATAMSIAYE